MTTDLRRHWQVALATLLIWCAAGPLGSIVQAADDTPAPAGDAESQALADRLEALVEQAAARVGTQGAGGGEPDAEVVALREQLEAAEAQITLLKNVVIQALRAQSAAEEALRQQQASPQSPPPPDVAGKGAGGQDLALADQVEFLTETVRRLHADVEALRSRAAATPAKEPEARSEARQSSSLEPAPAEEADAMLAESGMGGEYEPLLEGEAPAPGEPVKVAEVHFNSGSAQLTPGGERKARAAVERIRSMAAAKVRVVAFADRVGESAYNRVLSQERALSIAAVLESVGLPREMVEVVGSGEEDLPEPTADGVAEPLNRCAGIFVLADSAG